MISCLLRFRWLLVILSVFWLARPAQAQVLYGTITGVVEDPSGGVIPSASVQITGVLTGQTRVSLTDGQGRYLFTNVVPGEFNIEVSGPGFRPSRQNGVAVVVNSIIRVNFRLEIGSAAESVTVSAEAGALQTDRAEVRLDLTARELRDLPVAGYRNYQSLFKVVPGFTPPVPSNSLAGNPAGAMVTNVNGASNTDNNTRVDGTSNTYLALSHLTASVTPLEAIATVSVVTNTFDAEQGNAGGSVVSVELKSGTNQFHGSAFEYNINSVLHASNFFYAKDQNQPKDIVNQFGATMGGPIVRNKLFFFGSFEGLRERKNASGYAIVPTADQIRGDFRATGVKLFDWLTGLPDGSGRSQFPDSVIPASRMDPIAGKILALLPAPNLSGFTSNYFYSGPMQLGRNNVDGKVNWNASQRSTVFARYSDFSYGVVNPHVLGAAGGTGIASSFPGHDDGTTRSASIGGTRVVTPALVLDGHAGYNRQVQIGHDDFWGKNIGLDVLGIPGTNGSDIRQSGFPGFSVTGYTAMGNASSSSPRLRWSNQFQYAANAAWTSGAHNLRWGVEIARQHQNEYQVNDRGSFSFTGGSSSLRGGTAPNQFNAMSDFLQGLPSSTSKSRQTMVPASSRQWLDGLYLRDHWNVSRKLTLNVGLRWEYYPMFTRAHQGIERYDETINKVYIGRIGQVPDDTGVSVSKRLFAPRIGLAYRLDDQTVVRAGYGINIDPQVLARPFLNGVYPMEISRSYQAANTYVPVGLLKSGIPPDPVWDLGTGIISIPDEVSTKTLETDYRRGYIESFNFTMQRQLPSKFVAQAAYVGTCTIRKPTYVNINAAPLGTGTQGRPLYVRFGRTADTTRYTPGFSSNYHSLQAKLDHRFAGGWLANVSYTFSKALGYTDNASDSLFFQLPEVRGRNRRIAGFDRTHNLQALAVGELPFGKGKRWLNGNPVIRAIAGGWQVNGIFSSYSGTPFTVTSSATPLNAPGSSQVADQLKPDVRMLGGVGRGSSFFDPLAFGAVTGARFGTAGLNSLRGPGVVNLDLGLFRAFRVSERWTLQFRAEAFNATNTPHFSNPGSNVSSMTLNSDGTIRSLGGYTEVTSAADDSRQLRFGIRLSF